MSVGLFCIAWAVVCFVCDVLVGMAVPARVSPGAACLCKGKHFRPQKQALCVKLCKLPVRRAVAPVGMAVLSARLAP